MRRNLILPARAGVREAYVRLEADRAGNTRLSEHHTPQRPGLYGWYRPGAFSGEWRSWIGDNNRGFGALRKQGFFLRA